MARLTRSYGADANLAIVLMVEGTPLPILQLSKQEVWKGLLNCHYTDSLQKHQGMTMTPFVSRPFQSLA